jgi:hypothetical protein
MSALTETVPSSSPMVRVTGTGVTVPVRLAFCAAVISLGPRGLGHHMQGHAIDHTGECERPKPRPPLVVYSPAAGASCPHPGQEFHGFGIEEPHRHGIALEKQSERFSSWSSSGFNFFRGWHSTSGTIPATSELDWLI